jgi:hypothetical protein
MAVNANSPISAVVECLTHAKLGTYIVVLRYYVEEE